MNAKPKKVTKTCGDLKIAPFEPSEATAIQAMWNGTADPEQQRKAMLWILEGACGLYEISFKPGEDGRRETDFSEGRRFVGKQIAEVLRTNVPQLIANLRRREE